MRRYKNSANTSQGNTNTSNINQGNAIGSIWQAASTSQHIARTQDVRQQYGQQQPTMASQHALTATLPFSQNESVRRTQGIGIQQNVIAPAPSAPNAPNASSNSNVELGSANVFQLSQTGKFQLSQKYHRVC